MYTFIVKTKAPAGPRGRQTSETFVCVERDAEHARCLAIAAAHPGARVTSVESVVSVKRVHCA
jgi:hypothetical protein